MHVSIYNVCTCICQVLKDTIYNACICQVLEDTINNACNCQVLEYTIYNICIHICQVLEDATCVSTMYVSVKCLKTRFTMHVSAELLKDTTYNAYLCQKRKETN